MADDPLAPVTIDSEIDAIAIAALDKGLVKFITDSDLSKRLMADALPDQPLKQALARYLLRLLAPIVASKAKTGGHWLAGKALDRLSGMIQKIPGVEDLLMVIAVKLAALKSVDQAEKQFKDILDGHRPVHDHTDVESLTFDLQADLRLLSDFEGLGDQIAVMRAEIADWLNPQPPLTVDFRDPSYEGGRFHYAAQRVPFVGRTDEMERLTDFLYQDRPFGWWIVIGSGGMGKSRLALELILCEANVWRAGFLARQTEHDWQHWQPDRPTLIVVDYAYERPEQLRCMVVALRRRSDLEMPVRVVVLEREANGQWWDDFLASGGDAHAIAESQHDAPLVLEVPPLDDQFQMIAETFAAVGRPIRDRVDAEDIAGQVHDLDSQIRPLFVAFLADAMARHDDGRRWDRTALMTDVLAREYERWDALGADTGHRVLLALATLCRTLSFSVIAETTLGNGLIPSVESIHEALLARMSGTEPRDRISPLEPDLLGELFTLDVFGRTLPNDIARRRLLDVAWSAKPMETAYAIIRMVNDFMGHAALPHVTHRPSSATIASLRIWAAMTVELTAAYGRKGKVSSVCLLLDELRSFALAYPDEPEVRLRQAQSAVNLAAAAGYAGNFALAHESYDEVRALASAYPDEPSLRLEQATGAFNLVTDHGRCGHLALARDSYDQLLALASTHPHEAELRQEQAKGAVNLIIYYCKGDELALASGLYGDVRALASAHPDEHEVQLEQARGAFNLIAFTGRTGRFAAANRFYDDLVALARALPWPTEDQVSRSILEGWFRGFVVIGRLLANRDEKQGDEFMDAVRSDSHLSSIAAHFCAQEQLTNDA